MEKKSMILLFIGFILASLLIIAHNENIIKNGIKKDNQSEIEPVSNTENKIETTTNKAKEKDIMDGITVNYHASIRFEKNNKIIYFDPFKIENNLNDADYIFITHSHYDHYSESDIKKVMKDDTKFIITSDLEDKVKALGISSNNVTVAYPEEKYTVGSLNFNTIPAYNINKSFHKKSYNWVGYNVNIDGTKYYIVGDSDATDELKNVKCDVIFIPVGGTYTMNDEEAATVVNEMNPKYAVPIHYGESGSRANADAFVNKLNDDIKGIILK